MAGKGNPRSARDTPSNLHVVRTKLQPPQVRKGALERPALLERLRGGRGQALTLVSAPPGYGKTTLLASWAKTDGNGTHFVWLTLDEADSDPIRLWSHVLAGLQHAHPPVGTRSIPALQGGPEVIASDVLPLLVEELAEAPPIVLVLDDWHVLASPVCDQTLTSFLEWAPRIVQIVVSTRSDPGVPLARLRAHDGLAEVRAADLRLSPTETSRFFESAGLAIPTEDAERIAERTEGWPAGISLALLAARERDDPRAFLAQFSGETRHALDYLASEVLDTLPEKTRGFLVRTSILDPLSGPLCDAVLETSGSAEQLAALERANLFVTRLDERGSEYRYHQLFASVLAGELEARFGDLVSVLHGRAADWLEAQGRVEEAIAHVIASRDVGRASDLLLTHGATYWTSGRLLTIDRWLGALSWPEAESDPQLAIVRALVTGLGGGSRDEIERWLGVAESAPDRGPLPNGLATLHAAVSLLRAAFVTRGIPAAVTEAQRALEAHSETSPWRPQLLAVLGQALYLAGRPAEARPLLDESRAVPGPEGRAPAAMLALAYSALVVLESGDAAEAQRLARHALEFLRMRHLASGIVAAIPHLALGLALARDGDASSGAEQLERAVELAAPAAPSYWHSHALVRLARVRLDLGELDAAEGALEAAYDDLASLPDAGIVAALYAEAADALASARAREAQLGEGLSAAELRVVEKLAEGLSVQEVGRALWLSANTVRTHRLHIYRKLGVHTRDELIAAARRLQAFPTTDELDHPGERERQRAPGPPGR